LFKSIAKWKIWGIVAAIIAVMWFYIKFLISKNARLEHEKKVKEKIEEIHEKQTIDRSEALKNEKQTIKKRIKANSGKSRRDMASKL